MNQQDILGNLCSYDKRNPSFAELFGDDKPNKGTGDCYCDNCFYGRTELAEEILRLNVLLTGKE